MNLSSSGPIEEFGPGTVNCAIINMDGAVMTATGALLEGTSWPPTE